MPGEEPEYPPPTVLVGPELANRSTIKRCSHFMTRAMKTKCDFRLGVTIRFKSQLMLHNARGCSASSLVMRLTRSPFAYQHENQHPIKIREDRHELAGDAHAHDIEVNSRSNTVHCGRYHTMVTDVVRERGRNQKKSLPPAEGPIVVQD